MERGLIGLGKMGGGMAGSIPFASKLFPALRHQFGPHASRNEPGDER